MITEIATPGTEASRKKAAGITKLLAEKENRTETGGAEVEEVRSKSREAALVAPEKKPEVVKAKEKPSGSVVLGGGTGGAKAKEKPQGPSAPPEPIRMTKKEAEALELGLEHPPLWLEEGHLSEYGKRCGHSCGCCMGLEGGLKKGPFCLICRRRHELNIFTEALGSKVVEEALREVESYQVRKVGKGGRGTRHRRMRS